MTIFHRLSNRVVKLTSKPWLTQDRTWALALSAACLALYGPTLSPSIVRGDGGELQTLARVLGVPHATGYPLFLMLGWVAGHLPLGGDAAFRLSLLCTLFTAAAMAVFFLLLRELGVRRSLAALSTLLLASAPRVWMHAAAAEVYSLSVLFLLLGSWLLLRWGRGKTPLWLVTLVFGLALTHHISIRLLGPAVLVYLLLVQPRLVAQPRRWLPALGALLLPLVLYAYLPLRAAHYSGLPELQGEILGVPKTVAAGLISPWYLADGPVRFVLASSYSQQIVSAVGPIAPVLSQWVELVQQQAPMLAVLPLALLGLIWLFRQRTRAGTYVLLAYLFTTGAALWYLVVVKEDGDHFIPGHLFTLVWFAAGLEALLRWLGQRWRLSGWRYGMVVALLACIPLYNIVWHYPEARANRQTGVRTEAQAILEQPLPDGSIVAGNWSDVTPLLYLQRVEGFRPDIWVIHGDEAGIGDVLLPRAKAQGVPLYVLRGTPAGLRLLPFSPPEIMSISRPADLLLGDQVRWRGYDQPAGPLAPGSTLPLTLYWEAVQPIDRNWTTFLHLLDEAGERVAQVDQVPLAQLRPPVEWTPGELVADPYELVLPADLQSGRYALFFGWYSGAERLIWEDGRDFQLLGEVEVRQ